MSLHSSNDSALRWQAGLYFREVFALCKSVWNIIIEVNNLLYCDYDDEKEVEFAWKQVTIPSSEPSSLCLIPEWNVLSREAANINCKVFSLYHLGIYLKNIIMRIYYYGYFISSTKTILLYDNFQMSTRYKLVWY